MERITRACARFLLAGAVVVAFVNAGAANAAVILTSVSPNPFSGPGLLVETFDFALSPFVASMQLSNAGIVQNSSSGQYAMPYGHATTDKYVSVYGGSQGGRATFTFRHDADFFGLQWGSVDVYNTLDFYDDGILVGHFIGSDLAGVRHDGYQFSGGTAYVGFSGLFDTVVMRSSSNSFEFDNISIHAVPAPPILPLFAAGLIGLGLLRRRSRRAVA